MIPIGDDNSQRRLVPVVTWLLVIINVVVFFLELQGGDAFIRMWSFIPARFSQDPIGNFITIFTSMFLHAGWMHLGGNMLYLTILVTMLRTALVTLNSCSFISSPVSLPWSRSILLLPW